jgi:hypothetical protein
MQISHRAKAKKLGQNPIFDGHDLTDAIHVIVVKI